MVIDARIKIDIQPVLFELPTGEKVIDEDATQDLQHESLLAQAAALGKPIVKVEVQYGETDEEWEKTGDAVQVDFTGDEPVVTTLPPYAEVSP